eukprot:Opistho-2@34111
MLPETPSAASTRIICGPLLSVTGGSSCPVNMCWFSCPLLSLPIVLLGTAVVLSPGPWALCWLWDTSAFAFSASSFFCSWCASRPKNRQHCRMSSAIKIQRSSRTSTSLPSTTRCASMCPDRTRPCCSSTSAQFSTRRMRCENESLRSGRNNCLSPRTSSRSAPKMPLPHVSRRTFPTVRFRLHNRKLIQPVNTLNRVDSVGGSWYCGPVSGPAGSASVGAPRPPELPEANDVPEAVAPSTLLSMVEDCFHLAIAAQSSWTHRVRKSHLSLHMCAPLRVQYLNEGRIKVDSAGRGNLAKISQKNYSR